MGILTVSGEEQSIFVELWQYFYQTYLNPTEFYGNLGLSADSLWSIRIMILGLCIGFSVAAFGAVFNKRVLGNIVRKILKAEAFSPESALTLEELGLVDKPFAHFAVRKSTSIRRVVKCREELEFNEALSKARNEHEARRAGDKSIGRFKETDFKMNTYADSYFIPEKMKYTADIKFEKKGSTWLGAIIFTVIMVVVFIVAMVMLPRLLSLLNDIAGGFASSTPDNII